MMKKVFITTIIAICGMAATSVSAQTKFSFGIKANGILTDVKISDLQNSGSSFKPGATLGGFTKLEFGDRFALQPELLLNYTERNVTVYTGKTKFKYASVEMPIYAMGQLSAGNGKIFLGVGPHIGYGFSIDSSIADKSESEVDKIKLELSHWYMGGSVLVGYEFRNGIQINAGYKLGYDLSSKHKSSNVDTQTISLGMGYRF